jgi:endoglycosylceramidase
MRRTATLALCAVALLAAAKAGASAASAPDRQLSFLHVGAAGGPATLAQVLDGSGRQVLLRGVNVDGLVDYFRTDLRPPYPVDPSAYAGGACPPDDPSVEGVMVCDFDLAQMRPLGFDAIRLNISWSELEPQPGQIDPHYLERIAQVVGWARAQGIYVIIDMHQDAWSKYVFTPPGQTCPPPLQATRGYDGAPQWASAHATPVCALNGTRELDSAVAEDFQNFYDDRSAPDGVGLQEHFAAVFAALARRFHDDPTVAGYELLNEPNPGLTPSPGTVEVSELFPLYAKVIKTVLAAVPGFRQLFFIEPNVQRGLYDQTALATPWSAFSSYPNVVYAPHEYTGVFTLDQEAAGQRLLSMSTDYRNLAGDARALGLPLWVGEFGNNPSDDDTLLRTHYENQDQLGLGGTLWLWKENANDVNGSVFWGVYGKPFGTGVPQAHRIGYVARAYPESVAGNLTALSYDPAGGAFDLRATSPRVAPGDVAHATVLFVPARTAATVVAEGAQLQGSDRGGGSREFYVYPLGGPYHVHTGPAGPGSTTAAAATPFAVTLPSGLCASRRHFQIHVRARRDVRIRHVRVLLRGRVLRSVAVGGRRGLAAVSVDLRGLPRGAFRIRVVATGTRGGRRVRTVGVRVYHTCRPGHRRR